jgi:hypothetical protein
MGTDRSIRQSDHARIGIILFDEDTAHRIGHSGSMEDMIARVVQKSIPIDGAQVSTFTG